MKKLPAASLLELLPESILLDPKLRASAEALDAQIRSVTLATREVLHIPRLNELHGNILDYIAEQLHCDFFEPLHLSEAEKKNLIRESIAWHRIKGTAAAVEKIARDAFREVEIVEWFDYPEGDGQPYHFKIRSNGYKQTPDGYATFIRMVNVAKNTRSWIDNFEVDYSPLIEPVTAYFGDAQARTGTKEIALARPPNIKGKIFAGTGDVTWGNKTIALRLPRLDAMRTVYVGQMFEKLGKIVIGADPRDIPPYIYMLESPFAELLLADVGLARDGRIAIPVENYWQRQESYPIVGTADFLCGLKTWSIAPPRDQIIRSHIGQAYSFVGTMKISPEYTRKRAQYASFNAGLANIKSGFIKVGSSTTSSVDPHKGYVAYAFTSNDNFVGTGDGFAGTKEISLHRPELGGYPTVRVGQVISRLGDIKINADIRDMPAYIYSVESPFAELLLADTGYPREGRKIWPTNTYEREYEVQPHVAQVLQTVGKKTWNISKPAPEVTRNFITQATFNFGDKVIEPYTKLDREYPVAFNFGLANGRGGAIRIDSETKISEDGNRVKDLTWTSDNAAGTGDFVCGDKKISPSAQPYRDRHLTNIRVGQANLRSGLIKIDSDTKSSVDPNQGYVAHVWRTDNFVGVGAGVQGFVQITEAKTQPYYKPQLVTVRVGQPFARVGEIKVNSDDAAIPWDEFPSLGDWLRLWFDFPNQTKRTILLSNPREDLEKSDIRDVGDTAARQELLLNSAGEATTGITRAAMVTRSEKKLI